MDLTQIYIYLLGSPYVDRDSVRIVFDTRKALALLAYLVITGQPQQRDTLAALFWPENDQYGARAALRRTLSVLKAGFPEGAFLINREQICFRPGHGLWCDAIEFQRLSDLVSNHPDHQDGDCQICLDSLEEAVDLYRGDFLAGFSLRDSLAFDNWQYQQSEYFRQELAVILQKLTLAYAARSDFPKAIYSAQRWLTLDPLREEAHRQLMLCYAWAGQRAEALSQYRTCVRILEEELGVPPLEETTLLYHMLLEQQPLPMPEQPDQRSHRTASTAIRNEATSFDRISALPLVGRSRETEILLRIYQTRAENGHLAIIRGEPGIGKTRLAEEFLAFTRNQGARFLMARSDAGENSLAYAPFSDALRNAAKRVDLQLALDNLSDVYKSEALRLIPDLGPSSSYDQVLNRMDQTGTQVYLFEGIRQVILQLIQGKPPGILLLDDFHLADSASMQLLQYLVHRLSGSSVLIVLTCGEETLPEPLNQVLLDSQRTGQSTVLELKRLQRAEIIDLIRIKAPTILKRMPALAERVYRETEGLPFFIVEYLQAIAETGEYASDLPGEWPMPGSVQNLLRTRLKGLDETASQILTTAAVIGRSFDFDILVEASGRSELETIDGLEKLLASQLVEEMSSDEVGSANIYDFTHDKLRQLVYNQMNLSRRRLLHRRVAEALSQQQRSKSPTAAQLSQIAYHYQQGGLESLAAENYKLAGDYARVIYAQTEAIHHYQSALALKHRDAREIFEILGDLYTRTGEYNQAVSSYQTAIALTEPLASNLLEHKLGNLYHRMGKFDLAVCHFQSALELIHGERQIEDMALLYADWSRTAFRNGEPSKALEYAHKSLDLTQNTESLQALMKAHNILGILARWAGEFEQSEQHLHTSLEAALASDDLAGKAAVLNNLALLASDQKNYSMAIQQSQAALDICQQIGDRHQEAALFNHLAELHHQVGNEDLAMEYLKKAAQIFTDIGMKDSNLSPEIWMLSEW